MKRVINIVPIISILIYAIIIAFDRNNFFVPISYIPLLFGLLDAMFLKPYMFFGPGTKVAFFVMLIRYLISPLLLLNSHHFTNYELTSTKMFLSVALMMIEMFVIVITISSYKKRPSGIVQIEEKKYSFIIPVLMLFVSLVLSIRDPVPLSRYHFILGGASEMYYTNLEESTGGLPRLLSFTHKFLLTMLVIWVYQRYQRKHNKIYFWFGLIIVVLLACFYEDVSRNSMLVPLLTLMFLFGKLFEKFRSKVVSVFLVIVFTSMGFLTLLKQFKTTSFEVNLLKEEKTSLMFERYFGGTIGVYECMQHVPTIKKRINNTTLLTEAFGTMFFVGRIFNGNNRTSVFYNEAVRSQSFIIPTISEGFFHFGWLFCWLLSFIIMRLILYFDKLFMSSRRIDYSFVFAYISVSMGWMHPGNFIICMTALHIGLALLVFYLINGIIGEKVRF